MRRMRSGDRRWTPGSVWSGDRTALTLEIDVRIADVNWMQVEEYLRHDDRAVLPLGSTVPPKSTPSSASW